MKIKSFVLLAFFYVCSVANVSATVITGTNESTEGFLSGGVEVDDVSVGWTAANSYFGYFYNGAFTGSLVDFFRLETKFANVVDSSVWYQPYDTYNGLGSINEITDATQYTYSSQNLMFASKDTDWYRGILLAKQGDNYLAIDPLEIYINDLGQYTLKYQYWYGTDGETNLSSNVSVPEPSALLLFATGLVLLVSRRIKISNIV